MESTLKDVSGLEGLRWLVENYPGEVAFSTSFGQEDQVITDYIAREKLAVDIFTLDTGRLFSETYELMDKTKARYRVPLRVMAPSTSDLEALTTSKGFHSFYESVENRKECCRIRKIQPLRRALAGKKIWITGLRAEQSENRQQMAAMEWDESFGLFKFNPLMDWSYAQVLDYIDSNKVPDNPLHRQGFVSIGCAPCTRAIQPDEHPRAGRWWWEDSKKECGLHAG